MNVRNFFAMAFAAFLCAGLSSCKEDLAPQKQVINQGTIQGPGEYAPYTGPTTPLQVSFEVTKASPSPRKTKSFDVTFKQQGTGDHDLMQIDWDNVPVGKTYQLVCCLRSKSADWNATANDASRTVITGQLTGKIQMVQKSGKPVKALRITGTMNVPAGWINTSGKFKYKDMYFGAYLLSDGVTPETENGFMYGVTFTPSSMFAVHHDHLSNENGKTPAPKIKMLFGIPFTRVMLDKGNMLAKAENGSDEAYPSKAADQFYRLMPAGNILHFTLRNRMAYNIRFSKTSKFWAQTCMLFNTQLPFDFWKYSGNLKQMGTINCRYHIHTITPGSATYEVPINYDSLPQELTNPNRGYITLAPGDSIDFYVWGAPATSKSNNDNTNAFTIDFSKLGIQLETKNSEWVDYNPSITTVTYSADDQTKRGQFDTPAVTTNNYLKFEKTNITDAGETFTQGVSYHKTFDITSDLMIGLVGFHWNHIDQQDQDNATIPADVINGGLLQLYNPTIDKKDLDKYYLARTGYQYENNQTHAPIVFQSQGWDYTTFLGYALLLQIGTPSGGTRNEISAYGYNQNKFVFHNTEQTSTYYALYNTTAGNQTITQLPSQNGVIIGANAFYENPTVEELKAMYNTEHSEFATNSLDNIIGIIGIKDGRSVQGDGTTNTTYNQAPGSSSSGVMARGNGTNLSDIPNHTSYHGIDPNQHYFNNQMLNGWVLIKRNGKTFSIVDCYGPCPGAGDPASFISGFGGYGGSPSVFLRKATICQPRGIEMVADEWEKHYTNYEHGVPSPDQAIIGKTNR